MAEDGVGALDVDLGFLCDFLPGDVVRLILVRLPAKAVLRFRAVSTHWRRLLTDPRFIVDHHAHQPLDPVIDFFQRIGGARNHVMGRFFVQALCLRTDEVRDVIESSILRWNNLACDDGVQVSRVLGSSSGHILLQFLDVAFVCNPSTRQRALLPPLLAGEIAALYAFDDGRDFRVLYHRGHGAQKMYFIITLSDLQNVATRTRCIGRFASSESLDAALARGPLPSFARPPLRHGDSLYWPPQQFVEDQDHRILVFNTVTETFWWMEPPVVRDVVGLLVVEGKLAMFATRRGADIIELWLLEDNPEEQWFLKTIITLPVAEMRVYDDAMDWEAFVKTQEGDALHVLVITPTHVLNYDIEGRTLKDLNDAVWPGDVTPHVLEDSLVPCSIPWDLGPWF